MAIEHSYKEYQKRKQKEREVLDRSNDNERHGPRPATQFQPRAVKVKKEPEEEMDFKTRMKMMQNSKAAPKKTIFYASLVDFTSKCCVPAEPCVNWYSNQNVNLLFIFMENGFYLCVCVCVNCNALCRIKSIIQE